MIILHWDNAWNFALRFRFSSRPGHTMCRATCYFVDHFTYRPIFQRPLNAFNNHLSEVRHSANWASDDSTAQLVDLARICTYARVIQLWHEAETMFPVIIQTSISSAFYVSLIKDINGQILNLSSKLGTWWSWVQPTQIQEFSWIWVFVVCI